MGKALAEASPAARDVFARADAALGESLSTLCFDGPLAELTLTANTQPAILTTSLAALAALREAYPALPAPVFAAGHSLGEYSALVAAGALSLEDAVRLVRLRGRAMQDAVPEGVGSMAAVLGGDEATVIALCDAARDGDALEPANFNAPGQIVISGHTTAVRRAGELAGRFKVKTIPLTVSAPFHSSLMAPAARAVDDALASIAIAKPAFPIVTNVDATPNDDPGQIRSLLVRQIDGAVKWSQSVTWLAAHGVTHALEIGPGKVLAGLVRKIEKRVSVHGVADPAGVTSAAEYLNFPV
jgi:[acyl-carrier-protein] S-malonyltransferase